MKSVTTELYAVLKYGTIPINDREPDCDREKLKLVSNHTR